METFVGDDELFSSSHILNKNYRIQKLKLF